MVNPFAAQVMERARAHAKRGEAAALGGVVDECLSRDDVGVETLIELADLSLDLALPERALALAQRAGERDPSSAPASYKLGVVLQGMARFDDAERAYRRALVLQPQYAKALNNLGCVYFARGDRTAAMAEFEKAVRADPKLAESHCNLGVEHVARGDAEQGLTCFRRALALDPAHTEAQLQLYQCLLDMDLNEEAEALCQRAVAADPDSVLAIRFALMLPQVMHSHAAIVASRERMAARLAGLASRNLKITDPLGVVSQSYWFYLAYHGLNDRPLVSAIADFFRSACDSLAFRAPHCAAPRSGGRESRRQESRIRLGFVSSYLREHTIGKLMMGVIGNLPRERFEIRVFAPPRAEDRVTRYLEARVAGTVVLEPTLEAARTQIAAFAPDILFYTDIGMDAFTYFLAHARLAPLQCMTWGHPMTSGIPEIDCFVTHGECELPGSEQHYRERLLPLPAGDALTCYLKPDTGGLDQPRAHYGLSESSTLYLCPQTLFKLHPDQDPVFRDILAADPKAVLVFLEGELPHLKEQVVRRLRRVMPGEISRVVFLPVQPYRDFLNLIRISDVVLDTFVFGGGNSSIEAFAVGTPVVTLPSDQLRGRLTLACCRRMGIEDLVAVNPDDYVAKAVRLGIDRQHREDMKALIAARSGRLFEDRQMIDDLAELLTGALQRARAG